MFTWELVQQITCLIRTEFIQDRTDSVINSKNGMQLKTKGLTLAEAIKGADVF
jgi:hypothetical protein